MYSKLDFIPRKIHRALELNENTHSVVRDNINLIKINLVHETDIFFVCVFVFADRKAAVECEGGELEHPQKSTSANAHFVVSQRRRLSFNLIPSRTMNYLKPL